MPASRAVFVSSPRCTADSLRRASSASFADNSSFVFAAFSLGFCLHSLLCRFTALFRAVFAPTGVSHVGLAANSTYALNISPLVRCFCIGLFCQLYFRQLFRHLFPARQHRHLLCCEGDLRRLFGCTFHRHPHARCCRERHHAAHTRIDQMRLRAVARQVHRQMPNRTRYMLFTRYLAPRFTRMFLRACRQTHSDFIEPSEMDIPIFVLFLILRIFHILSHTPTPLIRPSFAPAGFLFPCPYG